MASLRESKKAATREALYRATIRLVTRDGLESVSVDTIAAEVGVSTRTFHNYFPRKEDALTAYRDELIEKVLASLESQPDGTPLWDAITSAYLSVLADPADDPSELVTLMALMNAQPSLKGPSHHDDPELMARFTRVCARYSDEPDGHVIAGVALGSGAIACRLVLEESVAADDPPPLRPRLERVLATVGRGFAAVRPPGCHSIHRVS